MITAGHQTFNSPYHFNRNLLSGHYRREAFSGNISVSSSSTYLATFRATDAHKIYSVVITYGNNPLNEAKLPIAQLIAMYRARAKAAGEPFFSADFLMEELAKSRTGAE